MKKAICVGDRLGRLVMIERIKNEKGRIVWVSKCDCGVTKSIRQNHLLSGMTTSCGCVSRDRTSQRSRKHGHTVGRLQSKTYRTWCGMLRRCRNKNVIGYENYGGRGISVCERWLTFENFLADMGEPPSSKHSIDRIDHDGNYEPTNCRWATAVEQNNNTRSNRVVLLIDERDTLANWCGRLGLNYNAVRQRLAAGWSAERSLLTPT